jgi:DNA gyrase inhibitor GyrI
MAYLIERKSQTIFVTATSIVANGKPREMIVESRPEYAVVQLAGVQEKFPVPWEEVYSAAKKRHEANLQIERKALQRRRPSARSKV